MAVTTTTTKIDAQELSEVLYNVDGDLKVYPSYSGRGMFGDTCFGLVGSRNDVIRFFIQLSKKDEELADDLLDRMATDNMGYDTIFYFPRFQLEGDVYESLLDD